MEHETECDAGPDDHGWQPPCDGKSCSYCWDREDNCRCRCEWIRKGYQRGYTAGYNDRARSAAHTYQMYGIPEFNQHGGGENP